MVHLQWESNPGPWDWGPSAPDDCATSSPIHQIKCLKCIIVCLFIKYGRTQNECCQDSFTGLLVLWFTVRHDKSTVSWHTQRTKWRNLWWARCKKWEWHSGGGGKESYFEWMRGDGACFDYLTTETCPSRCLDFTIKAMKAKRRGLEREMHYPHQHRHTSCSSAAKPAVRCDACLLLPI